MREAIIAALCSCLLLVPAFVGAAVNFDGINGVIDAGNAVALVPFPMTIEFWVRTNTKGNFEAIVQSYSLSEFGWRVYALTDFIDSSYNVDGNNSASCACRGVIDGSWHHVAFMYHAAGCETYTDGVLDDTGLWTGIAGAASNTLPLLMGETTWTKAPKYFAGDVDEMRLWGSRRTIEEVNAYKDKRCSGTEPNLVGYWRLDEGEGTKAVDLQDNATRNPGTHSGGVTHVDGAPITHGE